MIYEHQTAALALTADLIEEAGYDLVAAFAPEEFSCTPGQDTLRARFEEYREANPEQDVVPTVYVDDGTLLVGFFARQKSNH